MIPMAELADNLRLVPRTARTCRQFPGRHCCSTVDISLAGIGKPSAGRHNSIRAMQVSNRYRQGWSSRTIQLTHVAVRADQHIPPRCTNRKAF
jgi:hypothetical protein